MLDTSYDTSYDASKIRNFSVSRIPELRFGEGSAASTGKLVSGFGISRIALVTGRTSYEGLPVRTELERGLEDAGMEYKRYPVSGEPSPDTVDIIRDDALEFGVDAVVAVGGGSVLDTGKALAAMCRHEGGVQNYLEGVGTEKPAGRRLPLVVLPTTSGTGSEATKNAVISRVGQDGFKKSLRHEAFVPDTALLDPTAMTGAPPEVTAASGMDAVTQLLEAYVSSKANPFTDALALDGLRIAADALPRAVHEGNDLDARGKMAYAAYLSGIALANAGLGVVHGLSSSLGAARDIPHGVVCGLLLPCATGKIVGKLISRGEASQRALLKYGTAAKALGLGDCRGNTSTRDNTIAGDNLSARDNTIAACGEAARGLESLFESWVEEFSLASLYSYGFGAKELQQLAGKTGLKNTPVDLTEKEIYEICISSVRA